MTSDTIREDISMIQHKIHTERERKTLTSYFKAHNHLAIGIVLRNIFLIIVKTSHKIAVVTWSRICSFTIPTALAPILAHLLLLKPFVKLHLKHF